jgi:hypothetical protein
MLETFRAKHLKDPESPWRDDPLYKDDFMEWTSWQYLQLLEHDTISEVQRIDPDIEEADDPDRVPPPRYTGRSLNHGLLLLINAFQHGQTKGACLAFWNLLNYDQFRRLSSTAAIAARLYAGNDRFFITSWEWPGMLRKEKETWLRMMGKRLLLKGMPRRALRYFEASKRFAPTAQDMDDEETKVDIEDFPIDRLIAHAEALKTYYPDEEEPI